jgi:hypothetical protein
MSEPREPLTYVPSIIPPDATEICRGVWQWDLSSGARVMAVGPQADPLKDSVAWWDATRETMPPYEFLREYGMDFGSYGGKPVYPEFQDRLHTATAPLAYVPNRPLLRGWDVPGPVGVVWLQRVTLKPIGPGSGAYDGIVRCHVLAEFLMDGSIEEAGRQALAITREQFPKATEVLDFADPAAFDRRTNEAQSAADLLRRLCGIHLAPGPRTLTERHEPVRRWLLGSAPGAPQGEPPGKLLVDPGCPRLKDAFRSGYHYKMLPGAQGRYHDVPEKNWASHLMNALEYALARLEWSSETDPTPPEPLEFPFALAAVTGPGQGRYRGGRW